MRLQRTVRAGILLFSVLMVGLSVLRSPPRPPEPPIDLSLLRTPSPAVDNSWIPVPLEERQQYEPCHHPFRHCCIGQGRKLDDTTSVDTSPLFQKYHKPLLPLTDLLPFFDNNSTTCHLWMIGDSLSADHAVAAMCELTHMDYELMDCHGNFGGPTWGENEKCHGTRYNFPYFALRRRNHAGVCPKVMIRFTPARPKTLALDDKDEFLQQGGIAVWNWGAHCNEKGCVEQMVNTLFLDFYHRAKDRGWSVLWRQTEPQHFDSVNGLYRRGLGNPNQHCVPVEHPDNFRNQEAEAALSRLGDIPVVRIFYALIPRWDFHSTTSGDCTHYLYTPWRFHVTWDGMVRAMRYLRSRD